MNDLTTIDSYCELTKTELKFKRDVSKDEWQKVFDSLNHIEGCVQFWIGDCLKYREQKWGMYDDIINNSGLEKQTIKNITSVSKNVLPTVRNENISFTHHAEVASLQPEQQKEILKKAVDEKLTVRETRAEVKKIKHADKIQKPFPDDKYDIIYADPPWIYDAKSTLAETSRINNDGGDHYNGMAIKELCKLKISDISSENSLCFMWTTGPILKSSFEVLESWGFEYCTVAFVWEKKNPNPGNYTMSSCEYVLIGKRGKIPEPRGTRNERQFLSEKKTMHSKKPDEIRQRINRMFPNHKKIELFAREKYDDWGVWGNEV